MISQRTFYFITLWLPLVLPIALWCICKIDHQAYQGALHKWYYALDLPKLIILFLILIRLSLEYGVVPYVLFVIPVIIWLSKKDTLFIGKQIIVMPLRFVPVIFFYHTLLSNAGSIWGNFGNGLVMAIFAIILGYFYVGLTYVLRSLLTRTKIIV